MHASGSEACMQLPIASQARASPYVIWTAVCAAGRLLGCIRISCGNMIQLVDAVFLNFVQKAIVHHMQPLDQRQHAAAAQPCRRPRSLRFWVGGTVCPLLGCQRDVGKRTVGNLWFSDPGVRIPTPRSADLRDRSRGRSNS
jgi:hypothetical protein